MDAIYNRPFLRNNKIPVSLGGYFDMHYQHLTTDGISEGSQFQFRRLSLFVASSVAKRIKFMAELEFENDPVEAAEGKPMEISIEYAGLDFEFNPLLNLRGGVILNPIGAFNQNHDGPKWEFAERPIAMTEMLPATFSNAGFGFFGKKYLKNWMYAYEFYLTGGFDNSILDNDKNKTFLPQSKENTARLVSIASGEPLITTKFTLRHNQIGELGISWMGGIYNQWQQDGAIIDSKRRLDVFDLDFNTTLPSLNTSIVAEWAWVFVQVPMGYFEAFGRKQHGGFVDIIQPILKGKIMNWEKASLNLAVRFEFVDWNVGKFNETKQNIADDLWSIVPAISFRPTAQTVLRLNYRYQRQRDLFGNLPSTTGGIILGVSSYF
jgi:hypothetical protein